MSINPTPMVGPVPWVRGGVLALAVTLLLSAGACAPSVPHGPWVRSGLSGGFKGEVAGVLKNRGDYPAPQFSFDGAVRYGYVPANAGGVAFAGGLTTSLLAGFLAPTLNPSLLPLLLAGDFYWAVPGVVEGRATSVGVSASSFHVMPYVQLGSADPGEEAWFMTSGFLFAPDGLWSEGDKAAFLWLPSYTWVSPSQDKPRATHFSLGLALGANQGRVIFGLTGSAGMEFFRRAARVR